MLRVEQPSSWCIAVAEWSQACCRTDVGLSHQWYTTVAEVLLNYSETVTTYVQSGLNQFSAVAAMAPFNDVAVKRFIPKSMFAHMWGPRASAQVDPQHEGFHKSFHKGFLTGFKVSTRVSTRVSTWVSTRAFPRWVFTRVSGFLLVSTRVSTRASTISTMAPNQGFHKGFHKGFHMGAHTGPHKGSRVSARVSTSVSTRASTMFSTRVSRRVACFRDFTVGAFANFSVEICTDLFKMLQGLPYRL